MIMRPSINRCIYGLAKATFPSVALLLALAACSEDSGGAPPAQTDTPIQVVVTTNIMANWVENVGGDRVEVFSLVPEGADPHSFQPGAQDIARIADADLVLSVGLRLEESWLKELLENAARDPAGIVEMGELINPIEFAETHAEDVEFLESLAHIVHEVEEGEISPEEGLEEIRELMEGVEDHGDVEEKEGEPPAMVRGILSQVEGGQMDAGEAIEEIEHLGGEGEEEHEGHGHGIYDPHFWFDPLRVKTAINEIAARLSAIDPDSSGIYGSHASEYNAQLDELHAWTEEQVGLIPEDNRLFVTSHDSFGYFALLYGFDVVGVILGTTTESEPSAEDLTELIQEVEEYGVSSVFGETTVSERLAETVATETGAQLVRLYSGSLGGEDSDAETYIDMFRTNVELIVEALK